MNLLLSLALAANAATVSEVAAPAKAWAQARKTNAPQRQQKPPHYDDVQACGKAMDQRLSSQKIPGRPLLMFVTEKGVYFHYESCDVCNDVDYCAFRTLKISSVKSAHSLTCADIRPLVKDRIIHQSCR